VVSDLLGHESIQVTADLYMHVTPGQQQDAVALVGELLRRIAE